MTGNNINSNIQRLNYKFAFTSLCVIFFLFGFVTNMNGALIPHLQNVFTLTNAQSQLVNVAFFGAFFVFSIPAGYMMKKIGYKNGIITGLILIGIGCLLFYPAAGFLKYNIFLTALFILATGVVFLQVAVNPYATALGDPESASSRLSLAQGVNSVGSLLGPVFVAALIIKEAFETPMAGAEAVKIPYVGIAAFSIIIALIVKILKLPAIREEEEISKVKEGVKTRSSVWAYKHLIFGTVGILLYVGTEVSVASFLIRYLGLSEIRGLSEANAAIFLSVYWGSIMVGRFIGVGVLKKYKVGNVLAVSALAAIGMILISISTGGYVAMWSIILVGFFHSIMWPAIFGSSVEDLGKFTKQGSGILCSAIVGGAIIPIALGSVVDVFSVENAQGVLEATNQSFQWAFGLLLIAYLYMVFFGLKGSKLR